MLSKYLRVRSFNRALRPRSRHLQQALAKTLSKRPKIVSGLRSGSAVGEARVAALPSRFRFRLNIKSSAQPWFSWEDVVNALFAKIHRGSFRIAGRYQSPTKGGAW